MCFLWLQGNSTALVQWLNFGAGIAATAPLVEQSMKDVDRIFQTNTMGVLRTVQVPIFTMNRESASLHTATWQMSARYLTSCAHFIKTWEPMLPGIIDFDFKHWSVAHGDDSSCIPVKSEHIASCAGCCTHHDSTGLWSHCGGWQHHSLSGIPLQWCLWGRSLCLSSLTLEH